MNFVIASNYNEYVEYCKANRFHQNDPGCPKYVFEVNSLLGHIIDDVVWAGSYAKRKDYVALLATTSPWVWAQKQKDLRYHVREALNMIGAQA